MSINRRAKNAIAKDKFTKRGRPAEINLEKLLDIAELIFSEKGFAGTSTRELAEKAHCNLAMIAYYFKGKEGLYQAVLRRHFTRARRGYLAAQENFEKNAEVFAKQWPEFKKMHERKFCASIYEFSCTLLSHPSMHRIFFRELLAGGERILKPLTEADSGIYHLLRATFADLKKNRCIDSKLDERLAMISLVGPICYSFMAGPVLKNIAGFKAIDASYMRSLSIYLTQTFFDGWASK